ncbi:hypothetical protein HCU64_23300 [Methylobacterium sp. C25]|uniref:hypothetical protein n=1 Tax=Methylobacterium sp. C25 TaxID=2721622 RepID=UPI001F2D860B|nr:hypothetical protein [Methylobacterium sp. C25]MCE4226673.1 hypothetical protein [Methylobacterium sp. C25]
MASVAAVASRGPAQNPKGDLDQPRKVGQERGDQPRYVMRTSAFTRASLNPYATTGVLTAGLAVAAALILATRQTISVQKNEGVVFRDR